MHTSRGLLILPVLVAVIGFVAGIVSRPRTSGDTTPPVVVEEAPVVVAEDIDVRLGSTIPISLAELLDKPRQELAQLVVDHGDRARRMLEHSRENRAAVDLLPDLHLSLRIPVFQDASYHPEAGFSLPPYLKPTQKDAAVALHLARYGDLEAARKLADPTDAELQRKLQEAAPEKNYPVEWTRLTALLIQEAQLKMAARDAGGATEIVQLHRQLRELLDARAAQGPLGAALLPLGHRALTQASVAWRDPKVNKVRLADDIAAALSDWGPLPISAPSLPPLAKLAKAEAVFGQSGEGHTVAARGEGVLRPIDLLAMPFPAEGVAAVVAFLDENRQVGQINVVYRPRINQVFPNPASLGQAMVDAQYRPTDLIQGGGLQSQRFSGHDWSYDITLLNRSPSLGALVRASGPKSTNQLTIVPDDARAIGPIHLDRSFEQNRLSVRPDRTGDRIEIENAAVLGKLLPVPGAPAPTGALIQREKEHNLVAGVLLHWAPEAAAHALEDLLLPLWRRFGAAQMEARSLPDQGPSLALVWQGDRTRYTLRLSYDDASPELVVADARGPDGVHQRLDKAIALDQDQRRERFAAGKESKRLPRALHLDTVSLGMPRKAAMAALPRGSTLRPTAFADGISLLFVSPPNPQSTAAARQMFVRFADDKVAEIRVRYQNGPRAADADHPTLLTRLTTGPAGAPETLPAPWAGLWTDLPAQKPAPVYHRWLDDRTVMTYQQDAGGIEVAVRDCDLDHPLGVDLPPLRFVSRGVDACQLGDQRADLYRRWHIADPVLTADGALVLGQPEGSPFDAVLVYFDGDRVQRIVARHRLVNNRALKPGEIQPAMQDYWGKNVDRLGALRRQGGVWGQVEASLGWNDDQVRVMLFAQDTENGIRLFTEWREWPVTAKSVVTKP